MGLGRRSSVRVLNSEKVSGEDALVGDGGFMERCWGQVVQVSFSVGWIKGIGVPFATPAYPGSGIFFGLIFVARAAHLSGDISVPYVSGDSWMNAEMAMREREMYIPAHVNRGMVDRPMIPERRVQARRREK